MVQWFLLSLQDFWKATFVDAEKNLNMKQCQNTFFFSTYMEKLVQIKIKLSVQHKSSGLKSAFSSCFWYQRINENSVCPKLTFVAIYNRVHGEMHLIYKCPVYEHKLGFDFCAQFCNVDLLLAGQYNVLCLKVCRWLKWLSLLFQYVNRQTRGLTVFF